MKHSLSKEAMVILIALEKHHALPLGQLCIVTRLQKDKVKNILSTLSSIGYVFKEKCAAHQYYCLNHSKSNQIKRSVALELTTQLKKLPRSKTQELVRKARFCYGHMAGLLGVNFFKKLIEKGWIEKKKQGYHLTTEGTRQFMALGLKSLSIKSGQKEIYPISTCIDWTEREHHLSGSLGLAVANRFVELGWLKHSLESRVAEITKIGQKELQEKFDLFLNE
jgi:DNA-binding MarR family transcriptional regulator